MLAALILFLRVTVRELRAAHLKAAAKEVPEGVEHAAVFFIVMRIVVRLIHFLLLLLKCLILPGFHFIRGHNRFRGLSLRRFLPAVVILLIVFLVLVFVIVVIFVVITVVKTRHDLVEHRGKGRISVLNRLRHLFLHILYHVGIQAELLYHILDIRQTNLSGAGKTISRSPSGMG